MPWSRFTHTIRAFMKPEVHTLIDLFGSNSNHCNLWIPLKKLSKSDYKVMQNFFKRWYCTVPEAGYKYVLLVKPHPKKIGSARSSKIRWWRNIQATRCCWARLPPILLENLEFCIWSEKIFYTCTIFNKYNFGYFRHYNIFFFRLE